MVQISAAMVKELREATGSGIMDCKRVLADAEGNIEKAIELLRKKGLAKAAKRAGRSTSEGLIYSYIHTGAKLGVLLEVNCESDFVAKTEDFQAFAKNIAMHIAAANPAGMNPEDVDPAVVEKEKEILKGNNIEKKIKTLFETHEFDYVIILLPRQGCVTALKIPTHTLTAILWDLPIFLKAAAIQRSGILFMHPAVPCTGLIPICRFQCGIMLITP